MKSKRNKLGEKIMILKRRKKPNVKILREKIPSFLISK